MARMHPRVATTDAEIEAAIARGKAHEHVRPRAVAAAYREETEVIAVRLATGVELLIPRSLLQGLENASSRELKRVEVVGRGSGLHWSGLDVDHYVPSLIEGIFGNRRWMSEIGRKGGSARSVVKAAAARKNGRKGGRPRKAIVDASGG